MKNSLYIIFFLSLLFVSGLNVFAQTPKATEYNLLAPIPLKDDSKEVCKGNETGTDVCKTNASTYIKGLFTLTIGIATVLAVVMIIFGGIKYMSTDAFGEKNEARSTINNALWGLALALSAWLILATIDKRFVEFNLEIPVQAIPTTPAPASESSAILAPGPSTGQAWQNDSTERNNLTTGSLRINKDNCVKIGDSNCTSVSGISPLVVSGVNSLAQNCNCEVTITGGTEYWLHGNRSTEIGLNNTAHKPGGNVVDLSIHTGVTNYIRNRGTKTTTTGCAPGNEKYVLNGATYVYENESGDTHWHVCF